MKRSYFNYALLLTVFCLLGTIGFAQEKNKVKNKYKAKYKYEFCKNNNWSNGDKVSANDLREITLQTRDVRVKSENGRVTVKGENRADVLVRACIRAWADSEAEADSLVKGVQIDTSSEIRATNTADKNMSVSYEIRVPNNTNLDLAIDNGRISINSVQGQINFKTANGRVSLYDVSGDVKGRTNNGRVSVKLSGSAYQGNGLDVETGNGRVSLYMPSTYAANVEVGTGNGRFSSDFRELQVVGKTRKEMRYGSNKANASLNGGGAKIRVVTGNGRVSVRSNKEM